MLQMDPTQKTIHRSQTRGFADHGWLQSYHTFSFADYHDPQRMSFGTLRVLNDDIIAPGRGFGAHPHRDMEIVTIPLSGSLKHQDSTGNQRVIRHGEVQLMSAGTGIIHSEYNASTSEPVSLLQIWVIPKKLNIQPRYEQDDFSGLINDKDWTVIVSPDGANKSLTINQDAYFSLRRLSKDQTASYEKNNSKNGTYFFVISGRVKIADEVLNPRDAMGIVEPGQVTLNAQEDALVLAIEIPMEIAF